MKSNNTIILLIGLLLLIYSNKSVTPYPQTVNNVVLSIPNDVVEQALFALREAENELQSKGVSVSSIVQVKTARERLRYHYSITKKQLARIK